MKEIDIRELKFGIYCRKSSVPEDRQIQSIETQIRENKRVADALSLRYDPNAIYQEEKSAFTPGRSIFALMIQDLEKGKINGLIVVNANRLARNPIDAAVLIDLIDRGKLKAIQTQSRVFLPNSTDKMILGLELILSKKDSDDKSEFVKNGLRTKAIKGLPSGIATIGFLNDPIGERGNRKWIVDKDRFPLVQLILRRFLIGESSAGRLYEWVCNELKLTTPVHKKLGGQIISRSRLYTLLKDPINAGFFFHNGDRYTLDLSLPRMITEAEHDRILQLLGSKNLPKGQRQVHTFTGFIRGMDGGFMGQDPKFQLICDCKYKFSYLNRTTCPKCGVEIELMQKPKYLAYNFYYNVSRKKRKEPISCIEEKKVTDYLTNYLDVNFTLSPVFADWAKKYLHELKDAELEKNRIVSKQHTRTQDEYERKKIRYREMLADRLITSDEYKADMARLEAAVSKPIDQASDDWFDKTMDIFNLTTELEQILRVGTVEAKRRVLKRFGANLIWNEKELSIINTKPIQKLIDGLSAAKQVNPKFEPKTIEDLSEQNDIFVSVRPTLLRR